MWLPEKSVSLKYNSILTGKGILMNLSQFIKIILCFYLDVDFSISLLLIKGYCDYVLYVKSLYMYYIPYVYFIIIAVI